MLTNVKGQWINLSTVTSISAAERINPPLVNKVIPDRVILRWLESGLDKERSFIVDCDSFAEAQAECDRLAKIANAQRASMIWIDNRVLVRAADITCVYISKHSYSAICTIHLRGGGSEAIRFEVPSNITVSAESLEAAYSQAVE